MHFHTIALSFALAFRHQLIAACKTKDEVVAHLNKLSDLDVRDIEIDVVFAGVESPRAARAIRRFDRLVGDMDAALADHPRLA